ncbi:TPA: LOW QUALITY PROTEIN: hypothetical protein N0F65_012417, partial [Lagenidium giganteum]
AGAEQRNIDMKASRAALALAVLVARATGDGRGADYEALAGRSLAHWLNEFELAALQRCPCGSEELCLPVHWKQRVKKKELFAFSITNTSQWQHYDWEHLTTVAWNEDKDLLCHAHKHGVRVVIKHNFDDVNAICKESARQVWIEETYERIVKNHADGVNIDTEKAMRGEQSACLTQLVRELRTYLNGKPFTENAQISFDVPWAPRGVDGRYYDWSGLAEVVDVLFVMSYDMRSQVYYQCVAGANSPAALVRQGVEEFLYGQRIDPQKLVLGLPWYGYKYDCQGEVSATRICAIDVMPFFGAPCSDAAGSQVDFRDIMKLQQRLPEVALSWDNMTQTPFLTYTDVSNAEHHRQLWYDDARSLAIKVALVHDLGLGGVGMWNADSLDYDFSSAVAEQQTKLMWATLASALTASKNARVVSAATTDSAVSVALRPRKGMRRAKEDAAGRGSVIAHSTACLPTVKDPLRGSEQEAATTTSILMSFSADARAPSPGVAFSNAKVASAPSVASLTASYPLQFKIDSHDYLLSPSASSLMLNASASPSKKPMQLPAPCNFEALSLHFHLPLKIAAEKFGVRATAFKKRCRAIGIRHWPYRKVRSLKRSLQELARCKDQGVLNDKQQSQYTNFQRQLDKLLSPETYGIDPNQRSVSTLHFDDEDDNDSGDEDSLGSPPSSPQCQGNVADREHHVLGGSRMQLAQLMANAELCAMANPVHVADGTSSMDLPSVSVRFAPASTFDAYDHLLHEYKQDFSFSMEEFGQDEYALHGYNDEHDDYSEIFFQASAISRSPSRNTDDQEGATSNTVFEDDVFQQISPDYGCLV